LQSRGEDEKVFLAGSACCHGAIFAVGLSAGNLDTRGKAWLNARSEAAAVNVNGEWHAKEWGCRCETRVVSGIVSVNKIPETDL